MVSSKATTVADYLAELPAGRRDEIEKVLDVVRSAMPTGYREGIGYGMIGWVVPLADHPDTYNKQPLAYAGLAAQFEDNLACIELTLDEQQLARLDEVSKIPLGYPQDLFTKDLVRGFAYGGMRDQIETEKERNRVHSTGQAAPDIH